MKRCFYIGSGIPITSDGAIEKQGFERQNGYALGSLFIMKVADISVGSSSTAARAFEWRRKQLMNVP